MKISVLVLIYLACIQAIYSQNFNPISSFKENAGIVKLKLLDENRLVILSDDKTLKIKDINNGSILKEWNLLDKNVNIGEILGETEYFKVYPTMSFSANNKTAAFAFADVDNISLFKINIYDVDKNVVTDSIKNIWNLKSVFLNFSGSLLGYQSDNFINTRIYDIRAKKEIFSYQNEEYLDIKPCFSNDDNYLAMCDGNFIVVKDLVKREKAEIKKKIVGIKSICFSEDSKFLLLGDYQGKIIIWDFNNDKIIDFKKLHEIDLVEIGFSTDGKKLITRDGSGIINIFNNSEIFEAISPSNQKGHKLGISGIYTYQGSEKIISSNAEEIVVWDKKSHKPEKTFSNFSQPVVMDDGFVTREIKKIKKVQLCRNDNLLLIMFDTYKGFIAKTYLTGINTETGSAEFNLELDNSYQDFVIDNSGEILVLTNGTYSGALEKIRIIDTKTGSKVNGQLNFPIDLFSLSPDRNYLISIATNETDIKISDLKLGRVISQIETKFGLVNFTISNDSKKMAYGEPIEKKLTITEITNPASSQIFINEDLNKILGLTFSEHDEYLAMAYTGQGQEDVFVQILDIGKGKEIEKIKLNKKTSDLYFGNESEDKLNLIFSFDSLNNLDFYYADSLEVKNLKVKVQYQKDVDLKPEMIINKGSFTDIQKLAFSRNGKYFASANHDGIDIYNNSGNLFQRIDKQSATRLNFSSDGKYIIATGYSECNLWNVETGVLVKNFIKSENAVFSTDNNYLAVYKRADYSGSDTIQIIESKTFKTIYQFDANKYSAGMAFSPDNENIVLIRPNFADIWNIKEKKVVKSIAFNLDATKDVLIEIKISPDGKYMAAMSNSKIDVYEFKSNQILLSIGEAPKGFDFNSYSDEIAIIEYSGINIWNLNNKTIKNHYEANSIDYSDEKMGLVEDLCYNPITNNLICADGKNLGFLNTKTGEYFLTIGKVKPVIQVGFKSSGDEIAIAACGSNLKVLTLKEGKIKSPESLKDNFLPKNMISKDIIAYYNRSSNRMAMSAYGKLYNYPSLVICNPFSGEIFDSLKVSTNYINYYEDNGLIYNTYDNSFNPILNIYSMTTKINKKLDFSFPIAYREKDRNFANYNEKKKEIVIRDSLFSVRERIPVEPKFKSSYNNNLFFDNHENIALTNFNHFGITIWNIASKKQIFPDLSLGAVELGAMQMNVSAVFFLDSLIFCGAENGLIYVWDYYKNKCIKTFSGHKNRVNSLDYNSLKGILVSGSDDGSVKLWDYKDQKEIATIISTTDNNHIIVTPANYYYSTKEIRDILFFRLNNKLYPFEQFDLQYNRPDKVLESIGFSDKETIELYKKAYEKRIQKSGFNEKMFKSEWHTPEIEIINKKNILSDVNDEIIELKILAKDTKYKLARLNIWLNDVPVYGINGISVLQNNILYFEKNLKVKLCPGKNKIQVSAQNETGAESYKETVYTNFTPSEKEVPDLHIVALGVANYLDESRNLKYSVKDGRDMVNFFKQNQHIIWKNIFIDTLFNQEVTKNNIEKIKAKLLKTKVNDQVFVFVSGHGLLDDKLDFYYASHNMDFNDAAKNGIAYDLLESLLDSIPARKKLLLIDACHSGETDKDDLEIKDETEIALNDGSKAIISVSGKKGGNTKISKNNQKTGLQNSFELMQELFTDLSRSSGTVVLSAAAGEGYALESAEWNNGAFTFSLLNGLKSAEADLDKNGVITISELKEYVLQKVYTITNGKQKPTVRNDNLEFDFRIW